MNKMLKKRIPYALTVIAVFFVCLFSAIFSLGNKPVYAEESSEYQTAYIGDVIAAENFMLSDGDSQVKAEGLRAVYPSGGVFGGDKFTIEQAGKYVVTYFADVDGARLQETCTYMAVRKPQNMIVASSSVNVEYGKYYVESPYTIKKNTYGAIVGFRAGETISFAANLKTEKLTADYNILDLIVMPSVFKETDFQRLTVRLTDAADADNFVEIIIEIYNAQDGAGQVSYIRAGANGQQAGAFEHDGSFRGDGRYGTQVEHSFRGLGYNPIIPPRGDEDPRSYPENQTVSEKSLVLSLDYAEKMIYAGPISAENPDKIKVNDLDDSVNYKGNPWGGFTSDEVVVSVSASNFSKAEGKVLIKSFGDYDFSKDIIDEEKPEITVDCDSTGKMPVAKQGEEFPIFPFTAKDALDESVKCDVWTYYVDANGNRITVENDGKSFITEYAGKYEIVYRAEDNSGNVQIETIEITSLATTPNIFISIADALVEGVEIYETVDIPTADEIPVFGGSGSLKVERTVCDPNGQVLNVEDTLQLTMLGDYKVIYTVTDYLGNVQYGLQTIRAVGVEKPKFVETPEFDKKLIAGFVYDLPQVLVIETVNGEVVELVCKTYINGEIVDGEFLADGSEVDIRYVAEGQTGSTEWSTTISIVNTDEGRYKDLYFYNEGDLKIENEQYDVKLTFAEDCQTSFVNALYSDGFILMMSYAAEQIGFSSMAVQMVNAENRALSVTVRLLYEKANDAWFLQLNDSNKKIAFTTSDEILTFKLEGNGEKIVDASGVTVATIKIYDNGKSFQGFSDSLYLQFAFEGVEQESSICITQICNQSMGYSKSTIEKGDDSIAPVIIFDEELQLRQKLGGKAKIPTAKAFDVLSQLNKFTVKVMKDGEVLAEGPATEPVDVMLDEAGYYSVTYFARDTNGNKTEVTRFIYVKDETAPTLTVKDSLKDTYKSGDKVKIPTYSAKDNGENCYVQVTLIMPDNEMRLLHYRENGETTSYLDKESELYSSDFKAGLNTFVVQKKGLYILRVVAYDEYYNYTVKEIEFYVK